MTEKYIVGLETGVYLSTWKGDPGRTLKIESAERFSDFAQASYALMKASGRRGFYNAKTHKVEGQSE